MLGTGDLGVRICGSWENFVVHLRTFRALLKQVTILCYLYWLSHDEHTCATIFMHIELFTGM